MAIADLPTNLTAGTTGHVSHTNEVHAYLKTLPDTIAARAYAKRTITGNYTLVAADGVSIILHSTAGTAHTITLPPDTTIIEQEVAIPWRQYGTGQVTFAAGAGVTIRSRSSAFKSAGQYAEGTVTKVAANVWVVSGDVVI